MNKLTYLLGTFTLASLGLSSSAVAQTGSTSVGALDTRTSALETPALSMLKDESGYSLHLRYAHPGALGEFWVGLEMANPAQAGALAMVSPLVRQPIVFGPMQGAWANAYLPLPTALSTVGVSFYAQGIVYGVGLPGGMVPTDPLGVTINPDAGTKCEDEVLFSTSTNGGSGAILLKGHSLEQLIGLFRSGEDLFAEASYRELYRRGKQSIDPLLALANDPISGSLLWSSDNAFEAEATSFLRFEGSAEITVRRMALYLISALAMGNETPYGVNELRDTALQTQPVSVLDHIALDEINSWWLTSSHKSLNEIRTEARPLGRGLVDFGVAQGPSTPILPGYQPGSATPLSKSIGGFLVDATIGDQSFLTAAACQKSAYNCLSWAVHCDNCHGWVQPPTQSGADIDQWMMDNGWSMTPPAGGASQTVKVQKQENLPPLLPGSTWTHAMKKMPNCTWSSKNGAGRLYFGITDPEGFGNMHYPPPPATTNTFEDWYM